MIDARVRKVLVEREGCKTRETKDRERTVVRVSEWFASAHVARALCAPRGSMRRGLCGCCAGAVRVLWGGRGDAPGDCTHGQHFAQHDRSPEPRLRRVQPAKTTMSRGAKLLK